MLNQGYASATSPSPISLRDIPDQIAILTQNIANLDHSLAELFERLRPVMLETMEAELKGQIAPPVSSVPMAAELGDLARRVAFTNSLIQIAVSKLHV